MFLVVHLFGGVEHEICICIRTWIDTSTNKYIKFYIYLGDPIPIQSLSISNYNRSNPTKVLIHGFSDKGLTSWVKNFKKVPFIYDVTIL